MPSDSLRERVRRVRRGLAQLRELLAEAWAEAEGPMTVLSPIPGSRICKLGETIISVEFTVFGTPVPQGSTRAFMKPGARFPAVTSDNAALKPWRQQISATAQSLNAGIFPREIPIEITMSFYFTRPKSATKRRGVVVKPDIDKICRSILDGITGILIEDDSQVVEIHACKHYGGPPRVIVRVEETGG